VFTIRPSDEVSRAAQLMREKHVGYLVVVDGDRLAGVARPPVGVLTDRDIVVSVVARGVDPAVVRVEDIMTVNPITAHESDPLEAALRKMRDFGVRRLPVVNDRRELVGILAFDDVLEIIADNVDEIINAIRTERRIEGMVRPELTETT
jgi:CBS domain-containing protein